MCMHGSFSDVLVLVLRVLCVRVRSAGVMERDRLDLARGTTLVVNSAVDHERCAGRGNPQSQVEPKDLAGFNHVRVVSPVRADVMKRLMIHLIPRSQRLRAALLASVVKRAKMRETPSESPSGRFHRIRACP